MTKIQSVDEILEEYCNLLPYRDSDFALAKAALTRREERIKVGAQIEVLFTIDKDYPFEYKGAKYITVEQKIAELQQQLKALEGEK